LSESINFIKLEVNQKLKTARWRKEM
jgi:hypothetical protein